MQVTLSGKYTETWEVEAESIEEAEAQVRAGGGNLVGDPQWDEKPYATVHPERIPEPRAERKPCGPPCPDCNVVADCCSWCDNEARHLGDPEIACDTHKPYLIGLSLREEEAMYEEDPEAVDRLYEQADVGAYCPNTECESCDSWL